MTPSEAAWVRDHAWLPFMRRQVWNLPGDGVSYDAELAASMCECMVGVCSRCRNGRHEFCHRRIKPSPEWWIANRPTTYIPPTAVWYADRVCRPLCPCECPPAKPKSKGVVEQLDLFAVVAA